MIEATVLKEQDSPVGVRVLNHGDPIVCSAVSILMLNCAISIEEFTDAGFTVDSLILGLKSIEISYKKEIVVFN